LKPLPEASKPLSSEGNDTGSMSTASTDTASTDTASTGTAFTDVTADGITDNGTGRTNIDTDPYELNKLNAEKLSFTEDREMIMGHKFKYFRKDDKKGQVYSEQLFIVIELQACSHVKVLSHKDFIRNTVDVYLNCTHAMKVDRRTEKDKFVKILCTAAEFCEPEPLKEPTIYALCEWKEENPIWTWCTDL